VGADSRVMWARGKEGKTKSKGGSDDLAAIMHIPDEKDRTQKSRK
jgi:hypothetical protein